MNVTTWFDLDKSWETKNRRTCCMESWAEWATSLALSIMLLAFSCNTIQKHVHDYWILSMYEHQMIFEYWACMNVKKVLKEEVEGRPEPGPWLAQRCSLHFGSPSCVSNLWMKNQVLLINVNFSYAYLQTLYCSLYSFSMHCILQQVFVVLTFSCANCDLHFSPKTFVFKVSVSQFWKMVFILIQIFRTFVWMTSNLIF